MKIINEKQPDISLYTDPEEHVIVKGDKNFDLISHDTSLLRKLGFTKSNYIDKNSYRSELPHNMRAIEKIYLFIEIDTNNDDNLSTTMNVPIELNKDNSNKFPITKHFNPPLGELTEIFIKFKLDNDIKSNNYVDFAGESNELSIKVGVTK